MYTHLIKKITVSLCLLLLTLVHSGTASAQPPYAKWGRMAVQETMKKYPQAEIVDYLHVGRINKTATTSEETFKLLLQQGNRRWAVFVRIEFEKESERVVAVRFEETT